VVYEIEMLHVSDNEYDTHFNWALSIENIADDIKDNPN